MGRLFTPLAGLAVALLLVACGGGGGPAGTPPFGNFNAAPAAAAAPVVSTPSTTTTASSSNTTGGGITLTPPRRYAILYRATVVTPSAAAASSAGATLDENEDMANVYFENASGGTSDLDVELPWEVSFTAPEGQFIYFSLSPRAEGQALKLEVLVNGRVRQNATVKGTFNSASAGFYCC